MFFRNLLPALIACALFAPLPAHSQNVPSRAPAKARNVILFLADAGGVPALNAASLLGYNAPLKLHVQSWPHVGLSDTTPEGRWVSDSANGMTSIVTGVKTRNGVISMGPDTERGEKDGRVLKTILEYAEERGLRTGVVTDKSIADATPAACYSHANDRGKWGEIFPQAFSPRFGDGVDVLIGAGRERIAAQLQRRQLSFESLAQQHNRPIAASLEEVPGSNPRPVVVADKIDVRAAAHRALSLLETSPSGYFLMVEWDAHTDDPKEGLERLIAFDRLIREIRERVDLSETLLLFTADHSFGIQVDGGSPQDPLLTGYDDWKASEGKKDGVRLKYVYVNDTHTADEVAAIAIGPGAEAVHGFFPSTRLFHVMREAWGWPEDTTGTD
jgi:alkaline phosphatase